MTNAQFPTGDADFLLSRHPAARHDAISRLNGGRRGIKPACK